MAGIRIPQLKEEIPIRAAKISTPQLSGKTPAAAFGAGTAQADVRLGGEIEKLGGALARIIIDRRNMEEEQEVVKADTDFQLALQESLYSTQIGEDDLPIGLMNRKLGNAKGLTIEFDQRHAKMREQFLGEMGNDRQKVALAARMDSQFVATRGQVIRRESVEGRNDFAFSLEANLKQRVALSAGYTDPDSLAAAMDAGMMAIALGSGKVLGNSEISVKQQQAVFNSDMAKTNIDVMVSKNPFLAQDMLDQKDESGRSVRDRLPENVIASLQEAIDDKKIIAEANEAWSLFNSAGEGKAFRDEDNRVSREKSYAYIDGLGKNAEQTKEMKDTINRKIIEQDSIIRERTRTAKLQYNAYSHTLQVAASKEELTEALIENLWVTKKIQKPLRDSLLRSVAVKYDSNKYNSSQKSEKRIELLDDLGDLSGIKLDPKTNTIEGEAEDESRERLLAIRDKALLYKEYITKDFSNLIMQATQRNLNATAPEKVSLYKQVWQTINAIPMSNPDKIRLGMQAARILWTLSDQEAVKIAEETQIKAEVIAPGSQRAQTKIGDIFKGYKVTGFKNGKAMTEIEE